MDTTIAWIRILQILLGLVCLLTAGGACFVGVMVWARGDSRAKRIWAVLLGGGLGWLFGVSLNVLFGLDQWVVAEPAFQTLIKPAAGSCCWGVVAAFLFAGPMLQFVWLRRYRRK
jgi:hypothetical protein